MMRRSIQSRITVVAAAALLGLTACTTDQSMEEPPPAETGGAEAAATPAPEGGDEWFDQAEYDRQLDQRSASFEGDPEQPWTQYIDGETTATGEFAADGPQKVCFSNASISNPWRQTGWITMNEQLKVLQDSGAISEMETRDAQDDDNTQIADIDYFIAEGECDGFIISPNSTAAMTPAVQRACDTSKPVIVFDRGVETDCATTFIHPIGGFAWGIDTANFLVEELEKGDIIQTEEQVAAGAVRGLEKGGFIVTTQILASVLRWGMLGGSTRNNWFVDTVMSWIVAIVWLFVGPDMDAKVFNYGKKHGTKDVREEAK